MGLSIHVMPLWKFWAGQIPDTVINGIAATVVRAQPLNAGVEVAKREERNVMEALQTRDVRISWSQDDKVVFSQRFPSYDMLLALRAFAVHQTFPRTRWFMPQPFRAVENWSTHPLLRRLKAPHEYACRHVIFHAENFGWYLPAEFSEPINAEGFSIGSSPKLRDEMRLLERAVRGVDTPSVRGGGRKPPAYPTWR